ncbi:unnamed protein product [Vitrella brassicaformis CCMP3155]|uniref:Uncharacterized protein n=1 Tax=Vitrella brassicaformis (strain CCMP3155) TaxID=1169540 RepID=A0A0G4EBZ5_VITBC|nr:unnamed protein product [Vitrella brassicaformis CCMP3155]|eukprot:CEL92834.1 unnamed protein product [Vitrella brassicaformis CCMP3155]
MSAKLVIGRGPRARTIVFDREQAELGSGGTALVLKGVLPREDGSGGDEVAFKIARLQPDADDDEFGEDSESDDSSEEDPEEDDRRKEESREEDLSRRRPGMRQELKRQQHLRAFQGREVPARVPPFVNLYAAEVDPQSPATYTNTRGDAIPALCIAMPVVSGGAGEEHRFVELGDMSGWLNNTVMHSDKARRDKGSIDPQERKVLRRVSMLTKALLCTAKTHKLAMRRALCIDHFHNNVMLPKAALESPSSALQQSDTAAGTVLLDLANTLTPTPTPSLPSPPPAYLGPHVVVLPLDKAAQAAQGQYPEGCTPWHVSPELWVAMKGPPVDDEADEEAAGATGRINAGFNRTRRQLRAEGLLVGERKSEALMLGEPTIVAGIAKAMSVVMRADLKVRTAIRDAKALGAAEEPRAAEELLLADWDHYTATIITQDGRPLECRKNKPVRPVPYEEVLTACPGLEWFSQWQQIVGRAVAKGLRGRQSERGTIADLEEQLVRALQLLELEQVKQATEKGTSLQVPVALPASTGPPAVAKPRYCCCG